MNRRSFIATLAALVAAPFVAARGLAFRESSSISEGDMLEASLAPVKVGPLGRDLIRGICAPDHISDGLPVYPCWLWWSTSPAGIWPGWHRAISHPAAQSEHWSAHRIHDSLARAGFTHWHPDQPEAPTVAPPGMIIETEEGFKARQAVYLKALRS